LQTMTCASYDAGVGLFIQAGPKPGPLRDALTAARPCYLDVRTCNVRVKIVCVCEQRYGIENNLT
jgi:hypothetical protein